jgi:hypothetical protein
MVFEFNWLDKDVSNMLIVPDWLNILVDGGENKVA